MEFTAMIFTIFDSSSAAIRIKNSDPSTGTPTLVTFMYSLGVNLLEKIFLRIVLKLLLWTSINDMDFTFLIPVILTWIAIFTIPGVSDIYRNHRAVRCLLAGLVELSRLRKVITGVQEARDRALTTGMCTLYAHCVLVATVKANGGELLRLVKAAIFHPNDMPVMTWSLRWSTLAAVVLGAFL